VQEGPWTLPPGYGIAREEARKSPEEREAEAKKAATRDAAKERRRERKRLRLEGLLKDTKVGIRKKKAREKRLRKMEKTLKKQGRFIGPMTEDEYEMMNDYEYE
jgi:hypothetical protein